MTKHQYRLVAILVALCAGCGADALTAPAPSPVGHWSAVSLAGQTLPTQIDLELDGTSVYMQSWAMDFGNGGSFHHVVIAQARRGTTVLETDTIPGSGVWFQNGSAITIQFSDGLNSGNSTAALISGDQLTFSGSLGISVFRR